ncbi:MAG TPA: hypothetical protein PKB10_13420 [Tepidisphaeraceae bacterium]|nr:hypothetical protein [Tepidisphaeraceae bacterium]
MNINRKQFLQVGAAVAAGVVARGALGDEAKAPAEAAGSSVWRECP